MNRHSMRLLPTGHNSVTANCLQLICLWREGSHGSGSTSKPCNQLGSFHRAVLLCHAQEWYAATFRPPVNVSVPGHNPAYR